MGRLINTNDLMIELEFEDTQEGREENIGKIVTLEDIDRVPTAFDVDKVVKQLDEYITKIVGRKSALYQNVMKIIKAGGIR